MPESSRASPTDRRRRRALGAALALGAATLMGGCGQRGPLYFPEDRIEEEKAKRKRSSAGRPEHPQA